MKFKQLLIISISSLLMSCGSKSGSKNNTPPAKNVELKISKVFFFIENSGSMFGYVKQANEFISTLVGLSYMPVFDNVPKNIYFMNGKSPNITTKYIGNNPDCLKNNLNVGAFHNGNILASDLNTMFQMALDSVNNNNISILTSDCIYDVGDDANPLTSLQIETQKTQQIFRSNIKDKDIETVVVKAYSYFDGQYCYASKHGSLKYVGTRPYYIIFIGKSALLNKYITDNNLDAKIKGQHDIARFLKTNNQVIKYQAIYTPSNKGSFKPDHSDNTKILNAESDRHGQGFQFAIAVDYKSLPFSDSYLNDLQNYKSNLSYSITEICRVKSKINEVANFTPTHLITISTSKNPLGNLEIQLKNELPNWITTSSSDNENKIDDLHTYGFKQLIDAISGGYYDINEEKNITSLKFDIK